MKPARPTGPASLSRPECAPRDRPRRDGHRSVPEPVAAVPVPDGQVRVGADDDLEIELGQPSGPAVEDADPIVLAGEGAGPVGAAVLRLDPGLEDAAVVVGARIADVGSGRDP